MIKVLVYYPDRGDVRARGPFTAEYTRVPSLGEIVEAPAPLAPERSSLWEVTRVVHHRDGGAQHALGCVATITVEMERDPLAERVANLVVQMFRDDAATSGGGSA